jgi:hypothetical protein
MLFNGRQGGPMLLRRAWFPILAAGCLSLAARPARAEDGPTPQEDTRAKVKAQVEKMLKLMRENEAALLEASSAGGNAPKGPDVKVPELPPSPSGQNPQGGGEQGGNGSGANGGTPPSGGSSNGGTPPNGGNRGEEIRKRLDELIQGQQQGSGKIPGELETLIEMVPT